MSTDDSIWLQSKLKQGATVFLRWKNKIQSLFRLRAFFCFWTKRVVWLAITEEWNGANFCRRRKEIKMKSEWQQTLSWAELIIAKLDVTNREMAQFCFCFYFKVILIWSPDILCFHLQQSKQWHWFFSQRCFGANHPKFKKDWRLRICRQTKSCRKG